MQLEIGIGTEIISDGSREQGGIFQALEICDFWEAADYIYRGDDGRFIPDRPVNVRQTGRTVRYDAPGLRGLPVIRIAITFPGDGDEDVTVSGWARA